MHNRLILWLLQPWPKIPVQDCEEETPSCCFLGMGQNAEEDKLSSHWVTAAQEVTWSEASPKKVCLILACGIEGVVSTVVQGIVGNVVQGGDTVGAIWSRVYWCCLLSEKSNWLLSFLWSLFGKDLATGWRSTVSYSPTILLMFGVKCRKSNYQWVLWLRLPFLSSFSGNWYKRTTNWSDNN